MTHSTFLCGQLIRAYQEFDPEGAAVFLAEVLPIDLAGVLRGMEDPGARRAGECATDKAVLIAQVRG
jgi:hypothetical protein